MQPGPPLPDRIAVALWRRGAPQGALEVLQAGLIRGDPRTGACRAMIERIRSGSSPDDAGEVPELDLAFVAGLLELGQLIEARAVLCGAALAVGPGARLGRLLDEAMSPFPPEADPSFGAVRELVRAGHAASALRALDEVVRASARAPKWLVARQRALASLVRGLWRDEPEPVEAVTRETVLARIRARDLPAALEAARAAGANELAELLARLLEATERMFTDSSMPDNDDPETVPMGGHRLAELHIRMGVFVEAERSYRAMLRDDPEEERARTMLADVIALRRALGESPEPLPARPSASVGWLKKNAPRAAGAQGWAAGSEGRYAAWGAEPDEDSTANMEPAQEAELLIKLGRVEQALSVYRILAIRHPKQQVYRARIAEIEAMIAQRVSPVAAEATVQLDLSDLLAQAVPTNPRIRLERYASFAEEEDAPTKVDRLPEDD